LSLVPVRKKGKLPFKTVTQSYDLEYGSATIELHTDAFKPGDRVLVMDDLIATGGTMLAACELVRKLQAEVVEVAAIIDLPDLKCAEKLRNAGCPVYDICGFDGYRGAPYGLAPFRYPQEQQRTAGTRGHTAVQRAGNRSG